jgi:iron complex transport system ATP-binding protein
MNAHPTTPALEARSIVVRAGDRQLLGGVDLAVMHGEVLALAGPNGAGKSTLMKALAGDLDPDEGTVLLDGAPIASIGVRALAARRAVLPQHTLLQFAFTAREIVEMGRGARGMNDHGEAVVRAAMDRTEVTPIEERTYPTLSGGEQARVSLARVLAQEAPILLLDEPTAALDLRHQQLVMEIARDLAGQGAAVVAILHDLNLAAAHADRIALLHDGKLVACDRPWQALEPLLLSEIFDCPIAIGKHPIHGCPMVMPLPRTAAHRGLTARDLTID